MPRSHELDVQAVKMTILHYARAQNIDSAAVAQAMAEVLGLIAVTLDREIGRQAFDERIAEFSDVARVAYLRATHMMTPVPTDALRPVN